jgi:hypothetical protein
MGQNDILGRTVEVWLNPETTEAIKANLVEGKHNHLSLTEDLGADALNVYIDGSFITKQKNPKGNK